MNNQLYGLCKKCTSKINTHIDTTISYNCCKCSQNEAIFITEEGVVCLKCLIKEKESSPRKSQMKTSTLVPLQKSQISQASLFMKSGGGKLMKSIESVLSKAFSKEINTYLSKKSLINGELISWEKLVEKCNKASNLVYFFVCKNVIIGAFHTESVKIGENSLIEDSESGIFMTNKEKLDISFYKTSQQSVRYSEKSRKVCFGDPAAFEMIFDSKGLHVKTELAPNLKWQQMFVCKL